MNSSQIITFVNEKIHIFGFQQYKLNEISPNDVLHVKHPSGGFKILDKELVQNLRDNKTCDIGSIVHTIDRYELIFSLAEFCVDRLKNLGHNVVVSIGYYSFCTGACYHFGNKTIYLNPSRIFNRWSLQFKTSVKLADFITTLILHELGHALQDQEKSTKIRLKEFISRFLHFGITNEAVDKFKDFILQEEKDAWERSKQLMNGLPVEFIAFSKIKEHCLNTYAQLDFADTKRRLKTLINIPI